MGDKYQLQPLSARRRADIVRSVLTQSNSSGRASTTQSGSSTAPQQRNDVRNIINNAFHTAAKS
jgi:hypothetical protein